MAAKSRLDLARAAIRPAMWGKVMLAGPSGAGKTWTSLVIATTLVKGTDRDRILVIDTEKESALTYADEFDFTHLPWKAPYDPRDLAATLADAGHEYGCVIVDSFTHFWRGTGGTLDIAGGKYTGWQDARPAQVDVVESVLEADCHVIVCVREKQAHEQVQEGGKWKVVKLGLKPEQDDTFEYEVNVSLDLDMQHTLQVSKSRTNAVPVGTQFHPGHAVDFAVTYRDWLAAGEPVATKEQTDALIGAFKTIGNEGERVRAKAAFLEAFGRPEFLLVSRFKEAAEWVADTVLAASGGPVTGAATTGADTAAERPQEAAHGDLPAASTQTPPTPPQAADGDQGPLSDDRRAKYEQAVGAMTQAKIASMLETNGLSMAGTAAAKAERLVKFMVRQAEQAAAV